MQDEWKIHPRIGLGRIKFGMTESDVNALSATYGEIESERRMDMPQSVIDDTLAMFGDSISEADKQAFLQGIRETYTGNLVQVRKSGKAHLILEFDQDGLVAIQADSFCNGLCLEDLHIFRSDPKTVLEAMENKNGQPGRFRATEAAFDVLAISLDSFCVLDTTGTVLVLPLTDDRFARRSLTLRRDAYIPKGEMEEFVSVSFR